jgi:hypothetical protein
MRQEHLTSVALSGVWYGISVDRKPVSSQLMTARELGLLMRSSHSLIMQFLPLEKG